MLYWGAYAQNQIRGTVYDGSNDSPLPGVTILEKGTTNGTVTADDGTYSISVGDDAVLLFSFVGFQMVEEPVNGRSSINITLQEDLKSLEEVVVTAFGIEKDKKVLGYSVTEVSGDEFTESRAVNLGSALSGKIAGVNVSPPSSGVAGSSRVVIRGGSSLSGNDQPLYVINGVPIDNTTLGVAGPYGGSDNGDGLTSINPDDIESISVLKGNTAAALYGSRAANGVILITTKSGKAQKGVGISFNSNYTFDQVNDLTDFQKEYGHGANGMAPTNQASALENGENSWGARLDGSNVVQFDGVERPYKDVGESIKDFYRTGYTWTNTLGLSGGNETNTYRFSASQLNNEDIVPNSGYDRSLFSTNITGDYGRLSSQIAVQYSHEEAKNRPRLSDSPGNANFTALLKSPAISFESLKGTTDKLGAKEDGTELQHQGNVYAQNPYWAAYQFYRMDKKDRVLGSALLRYDVTDWLYVQGRLGTDYISTDEESSEPYGTAYKQFGDYNAYSKAIRENNYDLLIGGAKTFGDFTADILLGGNRMRHEDKRIRIGGNDLNIPFFGSVNNVKNQTYTYEYFKYGINSIFGQANFSYKDLLFLNLTGRKDYFSTLSRDNNSIFYPSVGLSLILSDMITLPSAFTFAKLRGSWAQVGGGAPDPYKLNLTYSLQGYQHNGAVLANITNTSIPNADLQPYTSTEFEVGMDLRFLENRIGIDFAYYNRKTENDILNTSISPTSGFGTTVINIGELENNGVELLVTGTPIRKPDFSWDLSFNMAYNHSNVVSLGENAQGEPIEFINLETARTFQEQIRNYVGEPVGLITGYKQKEINGQKVYDANGYPVRTDGYEILGEGRQPFSAGLQSTFRYKNFDLDFLIDMRSGGSLYSGTNVIAYGFGLAKETLPGRENGLTITGVDTEGAPLTVEIPVENVDDYYNYYNDITDYFVYDASFGKLRQLSLGYTFSPELLAKTPIKTLRLSFVGRNLFILWSSVPNVDPESAYTNLAGAQGLEYFSMPPTRNFGFNLSATF